MSLFALILIVIGTIAILYYLLSLATAVKCPLCDCRAKKADGVVSCDRCGDFYEFFV